MKNLILILILLGTTTAFAMPSSVILMRHAEEPEKGPEGVNLSKRGWNRAEALPQLFKSNPYLTQRGKPAALIAMKPKNKKGSIRCIETLHHLSAELNLPIKIPFKADDYMELADYLKNSPELNNKVVVVTWQHATLNKLAEALGASTMKPWNNKAFDRLWILDFHKGKVTDFFDLPQQLLTGDSSF